MSYKKMIPREAKYVTCRVTMNARDYTCEHCGANWDDGDNMMEHECGLVVHDHCWDAHIEKELLGKLSK